MDTKELQTQLDALVSMMGAKGLRKPDANLFFNSGAQPSLYASWENPAKAIGSPRESKSFYRGEVESLFALAWDWVNGLPSREEAAFKQFMETVARAVEVGQENGIDVEFVNPLAETMKRLSENALTFQSHPEATAHD